MEKIKVLFLDDEESLLEQGKEFLEKQDERLEVHTFSSAVNALEKISDEDFDVIVSDYQMPEKDGLDFLEELRENGEDIPFIIFTGRSREEVAMEALNLGADRYLQKKRDPTSQYGVLADAIIDEYRHFSDRKSLQKSEEEKRLVLDNTSEMIVHQNLSHDIVWADKKAVEYSDVEEEDLRGDKCYEVFREIENPCEDCPVEKTLETEEPEESKIVTSDNEIWLVSSNPLYNEEGLEGVVEVIKDVTERRRAERLADQVLESMEDAVIIQGKERTVETVNPALEKMLGYEEEEVVGKKTSELAKAWIQDEHDLKRVLDSLETMVEDRSLSPIVVDLISKDGEKVPISLKASTITDEEGEVVKNILIGRDVSQLKWVERELKKSETKYETIFESANDAIIVMNEEKFLDCNQKALDLFQCERNEFIGEEPWKFSPPNQPDGKSSKVKAKEMVNAAYEKGPQFFDWVHEKKDGTRFEAEVSLNSYEVEGEEKIISIVRDISGRKSAQEKFRRLFEADPDAAFLVNVDGVIEAVNDAAESILGFDRTELIGSNFMNLDAPTEESLKRLKINLEKRIKGEKIDPYLIEYETKDGDMRRSEVYSKPIREGGEIVGVVTIIRDVTNSWRARKKLSEKESQLRAVMEGSEDSIYMVDENFRYVLVNKELLSRIGEGRKKKVIGSKFGKFHSEEETEEFEKRVKHVFDTGQSIEQEHRKKGTEKWYLRTFSPIKDSATGEVLNVSVISKDITDYKKLENRLRKAKDRYKELFDGANELIISTNLDGTIVDVNKKMKALLGFGREELKGENILKLAPEEDREEYKGLLDEVSSGEEVEKTLRCIDHKGKIHWLEVRGRPIKKSGEVVELQCNAIDITERKERKEREEFLHSLLRHDLKNKLQLISNALVLLEKEVDLSDQSRKYFDMGKNSCQSGLDLINKVRTLRRIEEERIGKISISNVIEGALKEKEPKLSSEGIVVEKNIEDLKVKGGDLLTDLFSNLIENVIQHAEADNIRIDSSMKGEKCEIIFEDDGKGLPEGAKSDIFEKGYVKGESSGSGIGTFLVKEIVKSYSGDVEVEDSELGGARFVITLKRA